MITGLLRRWLTTVLLSLSAAAAVADPWSFKSSEREFNFSDGFRVVVTTDASKSTQSPDFHVRIYAGNKLLAHYPGLSFEHVAAAPDGKVFVGLSNRGIPGTAAAVFTRDGSLRLLALHGLAEFDYCRKSATLTRRWYDEDNPNVRFDGPEGITVRDCKGQHVPLPEVVARAHNNALQRTRASRRH